jgi:endoglucanase
MQDQDGSVFHKVSSQRFGGFVRPEADDAPRYFAPWSSEATANFVAALAGAARIYQAQDPQYAARCLRAAERSFAFLVAHPARHAADQSKFSTGLYAVPDDGARLWAAAEMWAATGRKDCLQDLEMRLRDCPQVFPEKWDYGTPQPLGGLTYLGSTRAGRDEALVGQLRSNLLFRADTIVEAGRTHGYARPGTVGYGWGYNGQLARQAVVLHAADRWSPKPAYRQAAADAVGFLLGRNVHGRSYVTGLGHQPPLNPHDRCSASDDLPGPWPGFLIGGPHPKPDDWPDEQKDYRTGEIAINWNSALVYALAWLAAPPPGAGQSAEN